MIDPFPRRELLDVKEVAELLGMSRATFHRWLKTDAARGFPRPVEIGKGPKGRPIMKYKKSLVAAFVDLIGS